MFFGIDLQALVETIGYLGVFAIVFVESGLFFGFFLPGDSLLFTAGFIASQEILNIWFLIPLIVLGAVLGDSVGYWFGRKVGPMIFTGDVEREKYKSSAFVFPSRGRQKSFFTREDSFWFSRARVEDARKFSERYGAKAIIFARFIPAVRTFIPIIAGVGTMHYGKFLTYNIMGGILWGSSITLMGYFLGNIIPNPDRYLLPLVLLIVLVSFIPLIREYFAHRKQK